MATTENNNMKEDLHCYIRVSSSKQLQGHSIEAQTKAAITYAEVNGMNPIIYEERGKSANNDNTLNRPELQRLLAMCVTGKVKNIYVTEIDRFARKVELIFKVDKLFQEHNIALHANNMKIDFNEPEQKFIAYLGALMGERENGVKTKRSTRCMFEAAVKGKWSGILLPYGYRKNNEKLIEVDPEEAEQVRKMVRWCLQGWGTNRIAKELNNQDVPTRGKKVLVNGMDVTHKDTGLTRHVSNAEFTWKPGTVYGILTNPILIGQRRYDKKIIPAPKILEPEEFYSVAEKLKKNKHCPSNSPKHFYLLKGLVRCARCGRNLYGRNKPKDGERVYMCSSKREKSCGLRSPNIDRFENLIWNLIVNSDIHLEKVIKDVESRNNTVDVQELHKEYRAIESAIKSFPAQKTTYDKMVGSGRVTMDEYDNLIAEARTVLQRNERRLTELKDAIGVSADKQNVLRRHSGCMKSIKETLLNMTNEEKHLIVNELIENITVEYCPETMMHLYEVYTRIDGVSYLTEMYSTDSLSKYTISLMRVRDIEQDKVVHTKDLYEEPVKKKSKKEFPTSPLPITESSRRWYDADS